MCLEETNEGKRGRRLHSGFGAGGRGGEGSGLYSEMETDTEIDTGSRRERRDLKFSRSGLKGTQRPCPPLYPSSPDPSWIP